MVLRAYGDYIVDELKARFRKGRVSKMEANNAIEIVEIDPKSASFDEVEKVIRSVFTSMSFSERNSFWAYRHKENYFVKKMMRFSGVAVRPYGHKSIISKEISGWRIA